MEIPAKFFFLLCCTISIIFSTIGLDIAERTFSDAVSPRVMGVFVNCSLFASCCLFLYGLVLHPHCGLFADLMRTTDPTERNVLNFHESKVKKWVKFAFGMAGTVLFQNFFRLTSFHQVVAFLCLTVAWLAATVLVSVSHDLGVFNFLLGNAIVGCTVNEYGLRGATWIAVGAAVLLYGTKIKLESVVLVNREGKGARVVL